MFLIGDVVEISRISIATAWLLAWGILWVLAAWIGNSRQSLLCIILAVVLLFVAVIGFLGIFSGLAENVSAARAGLC